MVPTHYSPSGADDATGRVRGRAVVCPCCVSSAGWGEQLSDSERHAHEEVALLLKTLLTEQWHTASAALA